MKKSYINIYLGLLVAMMFGIIVPIVITQGSYVTGMAYFFMITMYTSFRLAIIIWSQKLRLLEVTFFVFTYVFLGFVPLLQVLHHTFPWRNEIYDYELISTAGLIIFLGIVSYDIGIYMSRFMKNTTNQKNVNMPNVLLLTFIGIVSFFVGVIGYGGFSNLFLPRNELTLVLGDNITKNLLSGAMLKVPIFVATLFCLLKWKHRTDRRLMIKSNLFLLFLIFVTSIITLIASNPISSSRYWFGTVCLSMVFIVMRWRMHRQALVIVSIMCLLIVAFPYADVFRNTTDFNIQVEDLTTTFTRNGDFDAFQQVLNIQIYTDLYEYSYGKQMLGSFLFFVPRSIWPDKPVGTGATSAEALGYSFTNVSAPLWVEFYVNFGLIGVVIMFILYGLLCGRLQYKFNEYKYQKTINFYSVFVPVFAAYQLFLLRGDLLSSWANLAPVILFISIGVMPRILKKRYRISFS